MKKLRNLAICFTLLVATTSVAFAASGSEWYAGGTVKLSWYTGWNQSGDFISSTMEGYGSAKRVFARMGAEGTYSDWVEATEISVSVRDYGPFGAIGKGNYDTWGNVK